MPVQFRVKAQEKPCLAPQPQELKEEEKKVVHRPVGAKAEKLRIEIYRKGATPPPEEDADYDAVPIEEFGLAYLRGCGWSKKEGIGKTHAKRVKMNLPEPRPDRLGLGWKKGKHKERSHHVVKKVGRRGK